MIGALSGRCSTYPAKLEKAEATGHVVTPTGAFDPCLAHGTQPDIFLVTVITLVDLLKISLATACVPTLTTFEANFSLADRALHELDFVVVGYYFTLAVGLGAVSEQVVARLLRPRLPLLEFAEDLGLFKEQEFHVLITHFLPTGGFRADQQAKLVIHYVGPEHFLRADDTESMLAFKFKCFVVNIYQRVDDYLLFAANWTKVSQD